jgi:hypothetical protein
MDRSEEKLDVIFCRKCNVPMKKSTSQIQTRDGKTKEWTFHRIPRLGVSPPIAEINVTLPIEVFVCQKCRLVQALIDHYWKRIGPSPNEVLDEAIRILSEAREKHTLETNL